MVSLFGALRQREEGFGSQAIEQSLRAVARGNLKTGHLHQHTIRFSDPVLSVMDPYVFTLKQVLKCWDRHTMEFQWQYPSEDSGVDEKLIPIFKMGRFILCSEANRRCFKVLSLDNGKVCAETEESLYESIHRIGDRLFIKKQDESASEFNWKDNQIIEVARNSLVNSYLHSRYTSYSTMRQKLEDIGFSLEDWLQTRPPLLSIFNANDLNQLGITGYIWGDQRDYAVWKDTVFILHNGKMITAIDSDYGNQKEKGAGRTIYQVEDPQKFIHGMCVQDGYLILKLLIDQLISYTILDVNTFEEVSNFNIPNVPYAVVDYANRYTNSDRSLHFENGSYFRIMGNYLQVSELKHMCQDPDPHNHPLYTIMPTGIQISTIKETDDLDPAEPITEDFLDFEREDFDRGDFDGMDDVYPEDEDMI